MKIFRHLKIYLILLIVIMGNSFVFSYQQASVKACEMGIEEYKQRNFVAAKEYFMESIKADHLYPEPHYQLGILFLETGNEDEAYRRFQRARTLSPYEKKYIDIFVKLEFDKVKKFIKDQEFDKAIERLEKLKKDSPYDEEIHYYLFILHHKRKDFSKIKEMQEYVLELRQNGKIQFNHKGFVLALLFRGKESFKLEKYYEAYNDVLRAKKLAEEIKMTDSFIDEYYNQITGSQNPVITKLSKARELKRSKRYGEALKLFEELDKMQSRVPQLDVEISQVQNFLKLQNAWNKAEDLFKQKKYKDSIYAFEDYIKMGGDYDPADKKITEIKVILNEINKKNAIKKVDMSDAKYQENLKIMESLAINEDDSTLKEIEEDYKKAEEFFNKKNYERAIIYYRKVVAEDSGYMHASTRVKDCQREINAKENEELRLYLGIGLSVIFLIFIIVKLKNALPTYLKEKSFQKIDNAKVSGKWKKVISEGTKLLEKNLLSHEKNRVTADIANAYFKNNEFNEALKATGRALSEDSRNEKMKILQAKCFLELGMTNDNAMRAYEQLMAIEPNNIKLMNLLGNYYVEREKTDKNAVDVYKRLLKKEDNPKMRELLTLSFIEENRTDAEAISAYRDFLEENPDRIDIRQLYCYGLFKKGDLINSLLEAKKILSVDVENKDIHKIFFEACRDLKKLRDGLDFYNEISSNFSDNRTIKRMIDKFEDSISLSDENYQSGGDSSSSGSSKTKAALKICPSCSTLNPGGRTACKNCGGAL